MSLGPVDSRLSYIEQIIIIIIVYGGWRPPVIGPGVDPAAADTTRLDALQRVIGGRWPVGDRFSPDISRMTLAEIEDQAGETAAAITRLQAQHGELTARLKEMRSSGGAAKP
jgi:hypothetical protein